MKYLGFLGAAVLIFIWCIIMYWIEVAKKRKKIFIEKEFNKLHNEHIVNSNTRDEIELYNKIKKKYDESSFNIALEKNKVREKLGVYSNEKSNEYISKIFLVIGALLGAIFGGFIKSNYDLIIIVIYTICIVIVTSIKDVKPMRRNKIKIQYYSMCLAVLEELELERLKNNYL